MTLVRSQLRDQAATCLKAFHVFGTMKLHMFFVHNPILKSSTGKIKFVHFKVQGHQRYKDLCSQYTQKVSECVVSIAYSILTLFLLETKDPGV